MIFWLPRPDNNLSSYPSKYFDFNNSTQNPTINGTGSGFDGNSVNIVIITTKGVDY